MSDTELQPQAEWFFFNAGKAANGTPRESQQAIRELVDMGQNHLDDRLRSRAASIVALREWGNVSVLAPTKRIDQ